MAKRGVRGRSVQTYSPPLGQPHVVASRWVAAFHSPFARSAHKHSLGMTASLQTSTTPWRFRCPETYSRLALRSTRSDDQAGHRPVIQPDSQKRPSRAANVSRSRNLPGRAILPAAGNRPRVIGSFRSGRPVARTFFPCQTIRGEDLPGDQRPLAMNGGGPCRRQNTLTSDSGRGVRTIGGARCS